MRSYIDVGKFLTWNGMTIPKEPKNADYAEALSMVAAGSAEISAYQQPDPTDDDRSQAKRSIDAAAEDCRLLWVTSGSGQAMVYQEKRAEAVRWQAEGGDPSGYPILSASVGVEAVDLDGVAALVLGTTASWLLIAASIERLRLTAKKAVDAAVTWEGIDAAKAVEWPTP